ncbi:type II toxin-antitoxin system VapC family toxin [Sulfolobus acidocaldarius]|uniref:Conserved Archaeal protein n=5 Tax=Sulfolobus acidocaldarius TaxID=2285 RepID=Q4J7P3_SULAC|nr:PIN domain-containing protein [Sulfolobus acidocaldarius]AAY81188.1 conserved Archaeal protein [Sulfolobus acidocaldarius DSM 639]AGE71806.1 hypothetical protein SacN8_09230 [Sulfolobus acidocaldarius N8]AGE74077.1 hypothetical protein SacRon12I_09250 [Sulfolobus acidocaldarius Ron12/I]ALU30000.1 twitching motility protein PilT [Sulfolobus acidocaldarius]ALU30690.1 twitching motility protein PilT [Sulfolobus acidocaldarius]
MRGKFLFDASAIYPLIKFVDKVDLKNIYILHLTLYEVGNAIWKDAFLHGRIKNAKEVALLFQQLMGEFNIIDDPPLDEVIGIAISKGITYYDASYVYVSAKEKLILVSNDKELISKGNTISFNEFMEKYLA